MPQSGMVEGMIKQAQEYMSGLKKTFTFYYTQTCLNSLYITDLNLM